LTWCNAITVHKSIVTMTLTLGMDELQYQRLISAIKRIAFIHNYFHFTSGISQVHQCTTATAISSYKPIRTNQSIFASICYLQSSINKQLFPTSWYWESFHLQCIHTEKSHKNHATNCYKSTCTTQ